MRKQYIAALDGIRGIAMLLVLLSHASQQALGPFGAGFNFLGAGRHGVFLFFVLSAYLLTKQFLDTELERGKLRPQLSDYFFRRFARIYPLFAFAVIIYWLPALVLGQGLYIENNRQLFESLTLQKGYSVFWTIPVEVAYYFLLPLISFFIISMGGGRRWIVYAVLLLLIAGSAVWLPRSYEHGFWPFVFIFMMGSLLAVVVKDVEPWLCRDGRSCRFARRAADVCALGMLALLLLHIVSIRNFFLGSGITDPYAYEKSFFILGALACGVIFFTVCGGCISRKVFQLAPLRFLGKVSYSAYVWHMLILRTYVKVTPIQNSALSFYVYLAITLALSYASYLVFERWLYRSALLRVPWDYTARLWLGDWHGPALRKLAIRLRKWARDVFGTGTGAGTGTAAPAVKL